MTHLRALLRTAALGLQGALLVAFPLFVFAGVPRFGAHRTALALPAAAAALLALAAVLDDWRFILAYPALVNAALLARFGSSLRGGVVRWARFGRGPEGRRLAAYFRRPVAG